MKKISEKTTNNLKRILSIFLIVLGAACLLYGIGMYLSGFGGWLSFIWFVPATLAFLWAAMIRGKVTLKKWQIRTMWYVLIPIITVFLIVEMIIFSGFFEKPKEEPKYIVVLGTTVYEHGPCYLLRQRLEEAAKWAERYPDAKIIVSGGQGETEPFTEGSEMKRYLVDKLKVADNRIFVEEASLNTYENMTFSGRILEKEDEVFSYENTPVLVVTNNFHMYRALKIAKKAGFENVSGAPAPTYFGVFPHYMVREFCAILKNTAMGRM